MLYLVVALLLMFCIYLGFYMILHALQDDPLFREIVPTKIIQLLFYAFFVLLLLSNTIAAIGNIYTAQNMNLFLSLPVSSLRLYLAKVVETVVETTCMFVIFILPVAAAYYRSLPLKDGFFAGSIFVIIPFALIPCGLGIVFATVFVKFASFIWKRGFFLFVCLFGMGVWVAGKIIELLHRVQLEKGATNAFVHVIGLFHNPNPHWLPSRWLVDLISYFITGTVQYPWIKVVLLWSSALGSLALGYLAFDFFLLPVRSSAGVHERVEEEQYGAKSNGKTRRREDLIRRLLETVYRCFPLNTQFRAIILKDMTSLVRDKAQSLQLLMYLGIALVALSIIKFMSAAISLPPVATQSWWGFLACINLLFSGFIVTALMTRLVYPSISLEGKAFWILITAPIEINKVIRAKFWCWLPLVSSIALALILAGVFAIHPDPLLIAASMFVGICLSFGCTGLAIGIGSMFASFEWESPNQIAAGFGTLVLLLCSLGLVLATTVPASVLLFLAAVPAARVKVGLDLVPIVVGACMVLVIVINGAISSFACKRGSVALASRSI